MLTINHPSITLIWYKCKGKTNETTQPSRGRYGAYRHVCRPDTSAPTLHQWLLFASCGNSVIAAAFLLSVSRDASRRQTAAIAMTVYAFGLAGRLFSLNSQQALRRLSERAADLFSLTFRRHLQPDGCWKNKTPACIMHGIFDRYRRHLYHWHVLYVYCAEIMASCSDQLRNMVLHDMVFIKDIILALLLASIAPAVYRSIHKATGFSRNPAAAYKRLPFREPFTEQARQSTRISQAECYRK